METEIRKVLSSAGDNLLIEISRLRAKVIEDGYSPRILIVSKGYMELLKMASNMKYSHCTSFNKPMKIFGLDIQITDIEGILEVY